MDELTGIHARAYAYLDRYVQLGIASGTVVHVSFPETPDDDAAADHPLLDRIGEYLTGTTEDDFDDVDVGLTVPTEQRAVLEAVRDIPYGRELTVEQLAQRVPGIDAQDSDDRRAVREALAANPVPVFIPDHRVSDGPSAAPPAVEQRLRSLEGLVG